MNVVLELTVWVALVLPPPVLVEVHRTLVLNPLDLLIERRKGLERLSGIQLEHGHCVLLMEEFLGIESGPLLGNRPILLGKNRPVWSEHGKAFFELLLGVFILPNLLFHDFDDVLDVGVYFLGLGQVLLGSGGELLEVQVNVIDEVLGFVEDLRELLSLGSELLDIREQLEIVADQDGTRVGLLVVDDANHEPLDDFG